MNATATLRQTIEYVTRYRANREASMILLARKPPWRFPGDHETIKTAVTHVNGENTDRLGRHHFYGPGRANWRPAVMPGVLVIAVRWAGGWGAE
ncbi:hypothetical protein ABIG06_003585 [Bradyrhizobium sp. USDA 326]|uniref:hypothetical protein n=1 Tax=unclassified Bradyrhizobium TaxID=2631580 RepID=UPI0018F50ED1|nr:hypothetical protein [Bradyrhizobium sp. RP6]